MAVSYQWMDDLLEEKLLSLIPYKLNSISANQSVSQSGAIIKS